MEAIAILTKLCYHTYTYNYIWYYARSVNTIFGHQICAGPAGSGALAGAFSEVFFRNCAKGESF